MELANTADTCNSSWVWQVAFSLGMSLLCSLESWQVQTNVPFFSGTWIQSSYTKHFPVCLSEFSAFGGDLSKWPDPSIILDEVEEAMSWPCLDQHRMTCGPNPGGSPTEVMKGEYIGTPHSTAFNSLGILELFNFIFFLPIRMRAGE